MLVISIVDHASELKYHPQKPRHILSIKPSGFVAGKYQTSEPARLDVDPIVCKAVAAPFDSKPKKTLTIMISLPEYSGKNSVPALMYHFSWYGYFSRHRTWVQDWRAAWKALKVNVEGADNDNRFEAAAFTAIKIEEFCL